PRPCPSAPHCLDATTPTSPLNNRHPSATSPLRRPSIAVGTPISPTPHRSAIALESKQRVITRQLSLSLISATARLPTLHLCRVPTHLVLHGSTPPPPGSSIVFTLSVIVDSTIRLEPQVLN
ncbi:hypothetical protein HAX54_006746, partial [Datura stramonium]|nr:hypothetical protein [Datura stramonium]